MEKIRISLSDINYDSVHNLLRLIGDVCSFEIVDQNPDYLIHSCFGYEHLRHECVRICWIGENIIPDFNVSDYAIGFARMDFGDRYRRIPLYRFYFSDYDSLFDEDRCLIDFSAAVEMQQKSEFCTLVISNSERGGYFNEFYEELQKYKNVSSGGRVLNNIGGPVGDKLAFLKKGKFHLAFENSSSPGYITEKILHAFAARTVPIYWGAPDVTLDFNPKAFINCHDFASIGGVIKEIRRIDQDDGAYQKMLSEPCFPEGKEPLNLRKSEISGWLKGIFEQEPREAFRRNTNYWGQYYENRLRSAFFKPHKQLLKVVIGNVSRNMRKIHPKNRPKA